jgi:hypothetical protein
LGLLRSYTQARDVAAADVIRELIRQVRADPDLSAKVTADLERRREALAEAMRAAREWGRKKTLRPGDLPRVSIQDAPRP